MLETKYLLKIRLNDMVLALPNRVSYQINWFYTVQLKVMCPRFKYCCNPINEIVYMLGFDKKMNFIQTSGWAEAMLNDTHDPF